MVINMNYADMGLRVNRKCDALLIKCIHSLGARLSAQTVQTL